MKYNEGDIPPPQGKEKYSINHLLKYFHGIFKNCELGVMFT